MTYYHKYASYILLGIFTHVERVLRYISSKIDTRKECIG